MSNFGMVVIIFAYRCSKVKEATAMLINAYLMFLIGQCITIVCMALTVDRAQLLVYVWLSLYSVDMPGLGKK